MGATQRRVQRSEQTGIHYLILNSVFSLLFPFNIPLVITPRFLRFTNNSTSTFISNSIFYLNHYLWQKTNNSHDNGLYTYDSFGGESRKPSDKKFLWWWPALHQDLLKQFPSEHAKHSGLGGVLMATLVLASLAAGYAIYYRF
jgi:hypothetical protein